MNKKKVIAVVTGLVVVATMGLTGCGNSSTNGSMDSNQHITVALMKDDVQTLDPSKSTDSASAYILQESTEALAREEIKNGKDTFVPAGAKSWSVSPDGKTWTFKLVSNKWSDGKPVTADQYAYSIKRSLDPKTASSYAYLLTGSGIVGANDYNAGKTSVDSVGVKALDNSTLQIKLDHPCGYFVKLISNKLFSPQREDLVKKYGDSYGTTSQSLAYNGPFKITKFQNGDRVELVKNDDYWDKKDVKLSKVTMLFLKNDNSRMNAFQSGQIDSTEVTEQEWIKKFKKSSKYNEINVDKPETYFNVYNVKDKYLANAKIRKALSLIFDRKDYLKSIAKGIGKPAYSWVPHSVQIGNDEYRKSVPEQLKGDNEDPKKLFAEGLKEIGADSDPSKVTINYLLPGTDEINKEQGDYMMNLVKNKLGANIKCTYMEWGQYIDSLTKGNYEMAYTDWIADYNDPMTFFDMWKTGANIEGNNWSNAKYDALITDAQNTMDQKKRLSDFKQAENILVKDEAAIAPLYYDGKVEFTEKYVKGVQEPLFSNGDELKYAYTSGKTN
ncbi:MAG: peptide ABC transporter substrate-binding protein [Clostridium sp.]|nr:peptide ABC transporter substrate-binding protein [Clostridium sp.]